MNRLSNINRNCVYEQNLRWNIKIFEFQWIRKIETMRIFVLYLKIYKMWKFDFNAWRTSILRWKWNNIIFSYRFHPIILRIKRYINFVQKSQLSSILRMMDPINILNKVTYFERIIDFDISWIVQILHNIKINKKQTKNWWEIRS